MMDHMRTLLSYTLATMAGICFIGGVVLPFSFIQPNPPGRLRGVVFVVWWGFYCR